MSQEEAPPGKKFERMVKHIKKGYAKDGKEKFLGAIAADALREREVAEVIGSVQEAAFDAESQRQSFALRIDRH